MPHYAIVQGRPYSETLYIVQAGDEAEAREHLHNYDIVSVEELSLYPGVQYKRYIGE